LIPAGKIRCFISGTLRRDTKEENVRQRWARSLVEEYGYLKTDIAVEYPIKMGSSRKRADIVVFKEGAAPKQQNIFIIIEAKTEHTLPTAAGEGLAQLKSYMSASIGCRYGMWVGSEKIVVEKVDGELEDGVGDIPSKGDQEPRPPVFSELVPAVELNAVFKRCHNYIYANQGLQKAEAFHELLKLIFCKVYDETESTGDLQFYIRGEERRSEAGQRRVQGERIEPLFEHVKERYPYIFGPSEQIKLKRRVLSYIVSELQRISLLRTKADVKGSAYEELVGANLPGGFLVSYLNTLRHLFTEVESNKRGGGDIASIVSDRVKDVCSRNMFGLDINPFLVRTCQMNLVMHGDGSANVFPVDSLLSPAEWDSHDASERIPHGKADIVLTNPPFGSKAMVDDPHILSKFELSSYGSVNMRSSMPVEQLFVEAALKFLKPGGFVAIVLPE
jgi:type I restriction enzyme M protein